MNKKTIMAVFMAAALFVSACGCAKKVKANQAKTPNLFGNPDKSRISERGVMPSSEAKTPVISDLRSAYSVIHWEMYSKIVSDSEFTVEPYISEAYDQNAPEEITMYVFAHNDDYEWNTEDAYAKIHGSPIHSIVDQEYNTVHTYWIKGMLPKDMPTGKYTMVFVLPDGSVDSMADFDLVQPDEAPEPLSID